MTLFKNKQEFYNKHDEEIGTLQTRFDGYLITITKQRIKDYLCQFALEDKQVGLKLLQTVDYFNNERISRLTKQLGDMLKKETNQKFDNVYFCPIDASSGSSTDTIIRKLRNFMGMDSKQYDDKFIHISDLKNFAMSPEIQISNMHEQITYIQSISDDNITKNDRKSQIDDLNSKINSLQKELQQLSTKTIVFVDDYVGSGNSFKKFWAQIGSFYNENHNYVLATLIAHQHGISSIKSDIPIKIILPTTPIPLSAKIFHSKNEQFTKSEKKTIQKYCDQLGFSALHKYGYMDTQSMTVIYERSSNNILPILYAKTDNWTPLFPRTL